MPLGGVLSLLLFSIFINAVTHVISSRYNLYAEDLQLYRHFNFEELADVVTDITNDLLNVCSLAKAFWLHDNPAKSQAIIIGGRFMYSRLSL